jgi:hypothetical protein
MLNKGIKKHYNFLNTQQETNHYPLQSESYFQTVHQQHHKQYDKKEYLGYEHIVQATSNDYTPYQQ